MNKKPRILFYDIETRPLQAWIWRCGKQRILPGQLVDGLDSYDIICIAYEWSDGKGGVLDWGYDKQNSKQMIKKFTELCDKADVIIGKNNKRFDDKHVNTMRMIHGLKGRPDLLAKVDDLEGILRRHFYLPSFKLDYISEQLGFGGKDKMSFEDWINIVNRDPKKGLTSFNKMLKYCYKDVKDTKAIWKYCEKHFNSKVNCSTHSGLGVCTKCGSSNIRKNGTRQEGMTSYQHYYCNEHGGYAGKKSIKSKKDILRG